MSTAWTPLHPALWAQIPGADAGPDGYLRGIGSAWAVDGALHVAVNRGRGIWRWDGAAWSRVDGGVFAAGRTYGGYSVLAEGGRTAVFTIAEAHANQGAALPAPMLIQEAGAWRAIAKPAHDGWTWGDVDWQHGVIFAKQHHTPGNLWLSEDLGATWRQLAFTGRNLGIAHDGALLVARDDGIHRSADRGETWQVVSPINAHGKIVRRIGGRLWLCAEAGPLVSTDDGRSWRVAAALPGALWGPVRGRSDDELLVVARDGWFASRDGGATWQTLCPCFAPPDSINQGAWNAAHPVNSCAWDPTTGRLWCAGLGGGVWQAQVAW
jgi:hypothetical protein